MRVSLDKKRETQRISPGDIAELLGTMVGHAGTIEADDWNAMQLAGTMLKSELDNLSSHVHSIGVRKNLT